LNVYIVEVGNSIVSHCSAWEYRVFPMLKVPPRARYIRERVSRQLSFTFSNASQSVYVCWEFW